MYYGNGESEPIGRNRLEKIIELLSSTPDVRSELADEIREQLDRGDYLTEDKLNFAIYRMLKEILS